MSEGDWDEIKKEKGAREIVERTIAFKATWRL